MTIDTLLALRAEVASASESWLGRLLDAEHLARLAKAMGLGWFTTENIVGVWSIGLLRADQISSADEHDNSSVSPSAGTLPDLLATCDRRTLEHRPQGYGSSIGDPEPDAGDRILKFHPYRLFVLYHVQRTLKVETSNMQYLMYEDGVRKVVEHQIEHARRWTSSVEFGQRFDYWNSIAELAIVTEPFTHDVVHLGADPCPVPFEPRSAYEQHARKVLVELGQHKVRQMRETLAFDAEALDDNRFVHVLLRLMKPRERSKLKGQLGCAMHLLAMAETIRRAAEGAFGVELPEEDEIGSGQWFPGARKMLYGNDRVFDAPKRDLRDYLTLLGLDFGVNHWDVVHGFHPKICCRTRVARCLPFYLRHSSRH